MKRTLAVVLFIFLGLSGISSVTFADRPIISNFDFDVTVPAEGGMGLGDSRMDPVAGAEISVEVCSTSEAGWHGNGSGRTNKVGRARIVVGVTGVRDKVTNYYVVSKAGYHTARGDCYPTGDIHPYLNRVVLRRRFR